MGHTYVSNIVHCVFSTKHRNRLITPELEARLWPYLGGIAREHQVRPLSIGGTEDHIHILLKLHPSIALATLIKEYKAYSSGWMKKCGYTQFNWQEGYGGFSYSKSMLEPVISYIENQKQHHCHRTFKEEIELLKKQWGVEWDV